jgi:hypothetical protein
MDSYTAGWLGWLAYFVVLEGAALLKKRGSTKATLSGHIWLWFGVPGPGNPGQSAHPDAWARFRRAVLSVGMSWLTQHFMSGGAASGTLTAFFSWPNGGVWGNLVASLLWTVPGLVMHHMLMRRHTTVATAAQTQQLKDHITTTAAAASQNREIAP